MPIHLCSGLPTINLHASKVPGIIKRPTQNLEQPGILSMPTKSVGTPGTYEPRFWRVSSCFAERGFAWKQWATSRMRLEKPSLTRYPRTRSARPSELRVHLRGEFELSRFELCQVQEPREPTLLATTDANFCPVIGLLLLKDSSALSSV